MSTSFADAMHRFSPELPLAVAYSGGADSTALLLACAEKWPGQVHAIHVHHGLQTAADDFELHCRKVCTELGVPLYVHRVDARHAAGQSPEDAARKARYEAFRAVAHDEYAMAAIKSIVIAQHADDQAETLLLALSRGAGLPGLSAMPEEWERDGIRYYRPLLEVRGADLRVWLAGRGAAFIEDPSNSNEQFTRNRIRARLLPALEAAFPQFRETFARSAAHAAQAQQLLLEVAAQDLGVVGQPPVIKRLQAMSRPRQTNVLRYWLRSMYQVTPSTAQLAELLDQLAACTTRGHQIRIKVGHGWVARQGDSLTWYNP
ncbi:MAG: tRNA lysidine(34) synthetase TilS [Gammaproteobacteria bacterium]|nr:tRNA lysidine(34) synthetase TilS [Gammaproteobacteria bacterium]MBU0787184.1 tRNA lysidine(34) synthetase TilS [Gammaproteobacteria bacterium]MBU0814191.1 tRNA lysidine(34) synthetase TilS [Gammaproteobacteria bacterium]MBU1786289.1 tRNA lysidine(34) synthetase TilS [Gammaproteobacteria bacterium]